MVKMKTSWILLRPDLINIFRKSCFTYWLLYTWIQHYIPLPQWNICKQMYKTQKADLTVCLTSGFFQYPWAVSQKVHFRYCFLHFSTLEMWTAVRMRDKTHFSGIYCKQTIQLDRLYMNMGKLHVWTLWSQSVQRSILGGEVHAIFAELLQNKSKAHPKHIIFPDVNLKA